jgi:hypothetical protein
MQIREQVKDIFGTADTDSLLDDSVYDSNSLKKDKIKLERQRKQLQKEMSQYGQEYKKLMKKGASASEHERRQIAQQAKIAQKKYKIKQQQFKKNSVVMATIVTIEGARDLKNMTDEPVTDFEEDVLGDENLDTGQVQEQMMDEMVQFDLDMQMMQEVQESLDIDIMGSTMDDMGDDELVEDMRRLAEGDLDEEELDVEAEVEESQSAEMSMSMSGGIGDIEDEGVDFDDMGV